MSVCDSFSITTMNTRSNAGTPSGLAQYVPEALQANPRGHEPHAPASGVTPPPAPAPPSADTCSEPPKAAPSPPPSGDEPAPAPSGPSVGTAGASADPSGADADASPLPAPRAESPPHAHASGARNTSERTRKRCTTRPPAVQATADATARPGLGRGASGHASDHLRPLRARRACSERA